MSFDAQKLTSKASEALKAALKTMESQGGEAGVRREVVEKIAEALEKERGEIESRDDDLKAMRDEIRRLREELRELKKRDR